MRFYKNTIHTAIRQLMFLTVSCFILVLVTPPATYAQYELTGVPPNPTCDLCGKCRDAGYNEQQPPDWEKCRVCLYTSTDPNHSPLDPDALPVQNKTWTPIGCMGFDIGQPHGFIQQVLQLVIGVAGGLAFLGFLWGGFQLITSSGDPGRVTAGKSMIMASAGAFLLIIFSIFLLRFIGVYILQLPGFGS